MSNPLKMGGCCGNVYIIICSFSLATASKRETFLHDFPENLKRILNSQNLKEMFPCYYINSDDSNPPGLKGISTIRFDSI